MVFNEESYNDEINFLINKGDFYKLKSLIILEIENFNEKLALLKYISQILKEKNNLSKSLIISHDLVKKFPHKWEAYQIYVQDLLLLNKFTESKRIIEKGLYLINSYNNQKNYNINSPILKNIKKFFFEDLNFTKSLFDDLSLDEIKIYINKLLQLKSKVKFLELLAKSCSKS